MFDHLADPDPPLDTTAARRAVERRLRHRRRRQLGGGAAVVGALIAAATMVVASGVDGSETHVEVGTSPAATQPARRAASESFLTIGPAGSRHGQGDVELQERALSDGHLERVLLRYRSVDNLVAAFEPNGDVLVAVQTSQCGGSLQDVDPATGAVRTVGSLGGSVAAISGLAVSPDGRSASYIAYPACDGGVPIPTTTTTTTTTAPHRPPGTITPEPSAQLVIDRLTTGRTTSVDTGGPGDVPGENTVWSPDGTEVAVAPLTGSQPVLIFTSGHPSLATVRRLRFPSACSVNALGAWTESGLTASLTCRRRPAAGADHRGTSALEQVTPAGQVRYATHLPDCLAATSLGATLPGGPAVVEAAPVLFRESGCGAPATRIFEYRHGVLRTILDLPGTELTLPD